MAVEHFNVACLLDNCFVQLLCLRTPWLFTFGLYLQTFLDLLGNKVSLLGNDETHFWATRVQIHAVDVTGHHGEEVILVTLPK
jgi:hypothetical protein